MTKLTITVVQPVRDDDLIQAIAIRCSPVFGALSMANALGGARTDAWRAVREFTLVQLVDDALTRGLDLTALKAACCDVLVIDTPPFHGAVGYDPRPRCWLCGHHHWVPADGQALSCGDARQFRGQPFDRWTRATIELAIEGRYRPAGAP
jgi:hypothetical protein